MGSRCLPRPMGVLVIKTSSVVPAQRKEALKTPLYLFTPCMGIRLGVGGACVTLAIQVLPWERGWRQSLLLLLLLHSWLKWSLCREGRCWTGCPGYKCVFLRHPQICLDGLGGTREERKENKPQKVEAWGCGSDCRLVVTNPPRP